jgi:hypothetical protein
MWELVKQVRRFWLRAFGTVKHKFCRKSEEGAAMPIPLAGFWFTDFAAIPTAEPTKILEKLSGFP